MNIVLDVLRYLNEHDITLVKAAEATGVAQQNIKKSIGNNPKTRTCLPWQKAWALILASSSMIWMKTKKKKIRTQLY